MKRKKYMRNAKQQELQELRNINRQLQTYFQRQIDVEKRRIIYRAKKRINSLLEII
jgi:predicted nucleotidyltransferase